ncbi:hypothetical protein JG688_00018122 [Phytophthora aleatoria]|uniref:Uncharacterized protein n=1 Tax=Phytophthora aleatoria TaxID=2496075 RepID=A0A8J5IPX0_9STRA|nr:hypothetical protein JG688_00018122 [Phytophthora aleatoria]
MEQANALIQGTLVPVKDLTLERKTLEYSFNVTDALPVLHSISQADAPLWKSTTVVQIARKRKVQRQVTIVFPKNYPIKCLAGSEHDAGMMGLAIPKLGMFTEKDLIAMKQWQEEIPKLEAVTDLASWTRVSSFPECHCRPLSTTVSTSTQKLVHRTSRR